MTTDPSKITDKISDMYTQFPYPLVGNHSNFFFTWVYSALVDTGKTFNRILDAGCGTGNLTFDIARAFPDAEIVAVDVTDGSLNIAREKLSKSNFSNIEFRKSNLMEYDESLGTFDLIHSQGVIHHLASPLAGVQNLNRYLKDDGILYIWVYMALGREVITEIKEILSLLELDSQDFTGRLKMLEVIQKSFPTLGRCGGLTRDPAANLAKRNRPLYRTLNFLINGLKVLRDEGLSSLVKQASCKVRKRAQGYYDTSNEGNTVGLVDTYLNVNEIFFRFEQFNELLLEAGFKMNQIVQGMSDTVEKAFRYDTDMMRIVSTLPKEKQYALIELLERPSGVGFICQKDLNCS